MLHRAHGLNRTAGRRTSRWTLVALLASAACCAAETASAQYLDLHRLPPADSSGPDPPYPYAPSPADQPESPAPALAPADYTSAALPEPDSISGLAPDQGPKIGAPRPGIFQKVDFKATYLPGESFSDFGATDLELSAAFAFPFFNRAHPLVITPGFEMHELDGPASPDLPPRVYDTWLKFNAFGKFNDRWGYDVVVTPGWHSDFQNNSGEALRITGSAFAAYTWSDTLQLLFGAIYLDRPNLGLLPMAGLVWKPDDDTRLELVVPRPRFARRWYADRRVEDWTYIAGEFGGGIWAVQRADGTNELANYTDYRVVLGWERKKAEGLSTVTELGYVFGRRLELSSPTPNFYPHDTLMFRIGAKY